MIRKEYDVEKSDGIQLFCFCLSLQTGSYFIGAFHSLATIIIATFIIRWIYNSNTSEDDCFGPGINT